MTTCFPHRRVLALTTSHVGNNIFCTPGLRLLRKNVPEMRLDVVAMSARGASVFEGNPDIDTVYRAALGYRIRRLAAHYDLVLGLHRTNVRLLAGCRAKAVVIEPGPQDQHRADAILDFVQRLLRCSRSDADRRYVLAPRRQHHDAVSRLLGRVPSDQILVGFHLGSGRTAVHGWKFWYPKRDRDERLWPGDNYVALARALQERDRCVRIVLTGSRSESFLGRRFAKKVPETINLIGRTSLLELTALMDRVRVFVTQDTGALHVASASGVPLVGLFGVSDPRHTGPYPLADQHRIIRSTRVADIPVVRVLDTVLASLSAPRPAAHAAADADWPPCRSGLSSPRHSRRSMQTSRS